MTCPIICTLNTWRKIMQFCVRTEKRALCKSPYRGIAKSAYYLCTAMCVTNLNCRYDRLQPLSESFLSQCRRPVLHHIHKEKGQPDIQDANQRQQHTDRDSEAAQCTQKSYTFCWKCTQRTFLHKKAPNHCSTAIRGLLWFIERP